MSRSAPDAQDTRPARRLTGLGRVLVTVYGVMALAATGRSFVQIAQRFDEAPLAYTLSAVAAVVYLVATAALVLSRRPGWYRVATIAVGFELVGVLAVGTLSYLAPEIFAHPSVWSWFGGFAPAPVDGKLWYGYLYVPLVLPFLGLWYLVLHRPSRPAAAARRVAAAAR